VDVFFLGGGASFDEGLFLAKINNGQNRFSWIRPIIFYTYLLLLLLLLLLLFYRVYISYAFD